jgi:hypothetical protein
MAHNLNFNERTGRYSFFSVQKKAYGLGQENSSSKRRSN